jgi:hypothetical protein
MRRGVRPLFSATGIELEYMIVSAESLDVAPIADRLMEAAAGEITDEVERGPITWNNELALHVIELKTSGPVSAIVAARAPFQENVRQIATLLAGHGARLLPTGMHPWMDPHRELVLWPHDQSEVYATFDRIFSCRGHGWANLQSMHVNLPFADDAEFATLHAAIRFLLPVLPALAASSPLRDGRPSGVADTRLAVYRTNCARVPSVTAAVVPEPVFTMAGYRREILERMYGDIAPLDPLGVLQHEWLNARGAIARFDRMAIEIRVLDVQECPRADLGYAELIVWVLRALAEERWGSVAALGRWPTEDLVRALEQCVTEGDRAEIASGAYLRALGLERTHASARDLWGHLAEQAGRAGALDSVAGGVLEHYLAHGCLAWRIAAALGPAPSREEQRRIYRRLAECLVADELFAARPRS